MKRRLQTIFAVLLVCVGCARLEGCSSFNSGWSIKRVEERWNAEEAKEDLITFKNGKTWDNLGMKAELVASIPGPNTSSVLAFKAQSCVECEPDLLLTLRSTASEVVISESFPGKLTEYYPEKGESAPRPFIEIRAYYGNCLPLESTNVFVIDAIQVRENTAIHKVIIPNHDGLTTKRSDSSPTAVRAFRPGEGCMEIVGIDRDVE